MKNVTKNYLDPLLSYLSDQDLITNWMKAHITVSHSRMADANNERSARSFCFVVIGEHKINCATAISALPPEFIIGILLHEIAHMVIEEDGGDPELGVDEWVLENVTDSGYKYENVSYIGRTDKARTAKSLERVSNKFLTLIGI